MPSEIDLKGEQVTHNVAQKRAAMREGSYYTHTATLNPSTTD